jgi:hypothetical protein
VYAEPRESPGWEIDPEDWDFEHYITRWNWLSVNHYNNGGIRIERWGSWKTAMHYCLLWAPNSAPDANWRMQEPY